jgi:ribosomal protein S18 acetylase RimI-like enzyme
MAEIIEYREKYEESWLRCRVLSFLHTAYYDDVRQKKEPYDNESIGLIAINSDEVIGLIDIELEEKPGSVCSPSDKIEGEHRSGMIWHLAVHPDYRRRYIASDLLKAACERCLERGIVRLEAWTRDDEDSLAWYRAMGFSHEHQYVHWYYNRYADGAELGKKLLGPAAEQIVEIFCHSKEANDSIRQLERWHYCNRFDLVLKQ